VPNGKYDNHEKLQTVETTLGLLNAVEAEGSHSQRNLASGLGVALGLTNALIKRCIKKGLLKVREAPARRYAYYLTPKGFKEKSRLTAEYLTVSLDFFRHARSEYAEAIEYCARRDWTSVVLYGAGELAEIAVLAAGERGVALKAVVDKGRNEDGFHGIPVVQNIEDLLGDGVDAVIVTSTSAPQEAFNLLKSILPVDRIITPSLLHVSRGNGGTK